MNAISEKFEASIEFLRKETDFLNRCDGDIARYYITNNICDLDDKTPEKVTGFIQYRFFRKQIYTWAGQTLLAVQPYEKNYKKKVYTKNEPSINATMASAWFKLCNRLGKINQCIVISGDSGSGKTYSACVALQYLSDNCNSERFDILTKAWASVPILTAFGNASTMYNYNSSRFGKLIQIQYCNGNIVGAYIRTFLLERSRVSGPNRGETNFHIFNQILEEIDEVTLNKLYLNKYTEYKICPKNTKYPYPFTNIMESMERLDITQINNLMKIISLILNLGNIQFSNDNDKLTIPQECKQYVNFCANILECNASSLMQLFMKRLIAPKLRRGSLCYTSCINIDECQERKNSLMRFLYDNLFNWLVEKINKQMSFEDKTDCLGILDIYGFETFDHNTFEQLCINYANERLHQYYINDYYNKQVNYLYEKCDRFMVKYDLSKYNKRINLLDGTLSVFGILNEECLIKRYNTDVFISGRLSNGLKKHEFYIDRTDFKSTKFSIKHYAGIVEYDCRSMVNKNRDKIPEEMILFLKETKVEFLEEILRCENENIRRRNTTLLSKFKKSLDNLMLTLDTADAHYIKCLKPNQNQLPNQFDDDFFTKQLKYNGIMDTLNLEFQYYSTVITKADFTKRFGDHVLDELGHLLEGRVYIGRDKMYFNENSFKLILRYQSILMSSSTRKIQKCWRKRQKKRHEAARKIQKYFRRTIHNELQETIESIEEITVIENVNFKYQDLNDNFGKNRKKCSRRIFRENGIISRQRIAKIPVRFHVRKTCLPYSYMVPRDEGPKGLCDIF